MMTNLCAFKFLRIMMINLCASRLQYHCPHNKEEEERLLKFIEAALEAHKQQKWQGGQMVEAPILRPPTAWNITPPQLPPPQEIMLQKHKQLLMHNLTKTELGKLWLSMLILCLDQSN